MGAYSRILLPWDSQPQEVVEPDERWIQRGLVFANDGAGTIWTPAGFRLSAVDAGTPKRNATNYGIAVGYGTTHGTGTSDRSTDGVVPLRNTFRTIVSANFARSIGLGGAGRIMTPAGSAELSFEFFCPDPTSSGLLYTRQSAGGSLYGQWYSTTALTFGRWQVVGVSQDQSGTPGTPAMYLDGKAVGVSAYTTSAGAASNLSYTLDRGNRDSDSARSWDGFLGPLYIFESILTAAEHAELAANPWQLFTPRSIWVPVSTSAPAPSPTRSIVEVKVPWDSQPQEAVEVDWSNPLAAALKSAVYAGSGAFYDAATNKVAALSGFTGTATSGLVFGENGKSLAFDGTNDYASFGSYPGTPVGGGFTIAARVKRAVITTNQRIVVIRKGGVSYQLSGDGSSRVGAYTAGSATGGTSPAVGVWATVFAEFNAAGAAVGVYVNDGPLLNTSLGAGADATVDQYNIGAQDGANRFNNGEINAVFVWDRTLTTAERAEITRNPWQLFAPRSIWVPVSVGASGATDLTVDDAAHAHTADSPTLTVNTSTDLTTQDATHAQTTDSPTLTLDTTLTVDEALHAHTADNLTVSTTGAVNLVIDDATHAHTADALALTLDTTLAVADATHAHTADNLTISTSGAVNLTVDDAAHAHTADSPTLTLGYVDLIVAEALHGHTADSPTLSVVEYTDLIIARAVHAHTVDNLTLTFPLGALSDAEFREMYDWVKELHRIHGLTSGVDLVVTPTSRTAGAISQTISTAGSTVTVTR